MMRNWSSLRYTGPPQAERQAAERAPPDLPQLLATEALGLDLAKDAEKCGTRHVSSMISI
jgi:hypothetical protein